ncbi:MAG: glycosyltransferase family 39 protein [Candidatus Promineifilaceae bacterium]
MNAVSALAQRRAKSASLSLSLPLEAGLVLGVTALAAGLRFYKLGEWGFWIDELYTLGRVEAHYSTLEALLNNVPPAFHWLPLSLILTSGTVNALGVSEWSARLLPAVVGMLSVPILYLPVRKLFGTGTALLFGLLLALSPWHLTWSQNARFYTPLMLLYTLALLAFFFGLERDRPWLLFASLLLTYLALSERLLAGFIAPVVLAYLLAIKLLRFEKPAGWRPRNLVILALPVVAVALVEAYGWLSQGSSALMAGLGWFFLYRAYDPFRLLVLISYDLGYALVPLALATGLLLIARRSRAGLFFTLAAVVPVALLVGLNRILFTQDRYAFVALPAWLILAGVAVRELGARLPGRSGWLAVGVAGMLAAEALSADLLYYQVNNGNRRDWKGAFSLIDAEARPGDLVVAYWPELVEHYLNAEGLAWAEVRVQQLSGQNQRVWFVLDSETEWANPAGRQWVLENARLMDVRYLRTPENANVRLYLYDPDPEG